MIDVLEYLADHGATHQADLAGPCGSATDVEGATVRYIGEGLVTKDSRSKLKLTHKGVARVNGGRALEVKPQSSLPRLAEIVEELGEVEGHEHIFTVLRDVVGTVIQVRIADLLGVPDDLKLLTDIHHKLARRAKS